MKVSIIMYQPPEDSATILHVFAGASKVKAKKLAIAKLVADDMPVRLIENDGEWMVEERYMDDDYPDGYTPWMESGATVSLQTFNVKK